jgi:hypothetical protein
MNEEKLIQFLERYPVEVYDFIRRIMTGEEILIHHTDPERNGGA